jgi:hypothetical protein
MKQTLDHLKSMKKPVHRTIYIAGDNQLAEEVSSLEEEVRRLRLALELRQDAAAAERLPFAESELSTKKALLNETSVKFTFKSMRRDRYDALINEHPPTDAQRKEAEAAGEAGLNFNPDTYPIALIVECMVEPEVEDRQEMIDWLNGDSWNTHELMTLFQVCLAVNTTSRVVTLGKD